MPRELIERPKQGFRMPVACWLPDELRDWADALLIFVDLESAGLHAGVVQAIWKDNLSVRDRLSEIWTVLIYRQWQGNWKQGRV